MIRTQRQNPTRSGGNGVVVDDHIDDYDDDYDIDDSGYDIGASMRRQPHLVRHTGGWYRRISQRIAWR